MDEKKVCIYPCNGVGNILSSVTRMAGYMVVEDLLPGRSTLLCLPALLRGVDEDVEMIEQAPTIVIEGCAQKCASNALIQLGIRPYSRVYVPDIIKETGLNPGNSRRQLDEGGIQLAKKVAEKVVEEANSIFNNPDYKYEEQFIKRIEGFFDWTINVEKKLNYVEIKPAIYRSRKSEGCTSCCGR